MTSECACFKDGEVHTVSDCGYVCVEEREASLFQDKMEKLDHFVVTFGVFLNPPQP